MPSPDPGHGPADPTADPAGNPAGNPAAGVALAARLVQPDRTSCGSAALVMARVFADPAYAAYLVNGVDPVLSRRRPESVGDRFRSEVMAMHRRTNGVVDARGRPQLPWPRALGTLPWSIARQLTSDTGTTYDARLVLRHQRGGSFDRIYATVSAARTVPVFVGNHLSARHVVLAVCTVPEGVLVYDPARGTSNPVDRDDFVHGRLALAGWQVPWFVIVPR